MLSRLSVVLSLPFPGLVTETKAMRIPLLLVFSNTNHLHCTLLCCAVLCGAVLDAHIVECATLPMVNDDEP